MTLTSSQVAPRFTSQDLARLKKFLGDTLMRALEMEGVPAAQRTNFAKQNIGRVFEQTQLKLPEDMKKQIFEQVLNDLLGYGPIQALLEDPDISEIMVNGPKKGLCRKKRTTHQEQCGI